MRRITPLLLSIAAPAMLAAQSAAPASFAPDPRVDSIFAEYTRPNSPGCAVGAYRDDRLIYARGYGLADIERGVPITSRSVFDIGSTSKQFAATVIVLLAQEGKLSLDDDVRRYIPELPVYERPITIRQMLHHTSGLRDYIGLLVLSGHQIDDVTTPEDALRILSRQRALNFLPGDEHLYSNSGYFLLSIIVQRVTGKSLREEAKARIFEPLGMRNTEYLGSYDDLIAQRALAYESRGEGYRLDVSRWLQLGDGAVFTTVEDLLLWDRNFYTPTVGGRALLDTLHTRGVLTKGERINYALGLMHGELRGVPTVRHGGSWGGYRAELLRLPSLHYAVAVLCNHGGSNPSALADAVAGVHLGNALRAEPAAAAAPSARRSSTPGVSVPSATLQRYVGTFRAPGATMLFTFVHDSTGLRLTSPGRYGLTALSSTRFRVEGLPFEVSFEFHSAPGTGPINAATLREADSPEQTIQRLNIVTPSAAELAAYTGAFESDELDGRWQVTADSSGLRVQHPGAAAMRMRALTKDEFSGGGLTIRFQRNEGGTVIGAALDQGRAKNIGLRRVSSP